MYMHVYAIIQKWRLEPAIHGEYLKGLGTYHLGLSAVGDKPAKFLQF